MTSEAVATWDRALADLRAAGATVEPFTPSVTLSTYRSAFSDAERARADVKGDSRSPAATANALYRYFAGRASDPLQAVRRGYGAYRSFYDVLPERFDDCVALLEQPLERDPAGQSFARSRADIVAALERSMRSAGVVAMIYPTMPFNAFSLAQGWPDIRTALGFGNWLGLPEVSVPAGLGVDGLPALNLSVTGLPGADARVLALAHAYERHSRRIVPPPRP
jgi:aspartyl-tRNA(Asn)/glutamyl-tRNA(Gln) amidotransferase subunit A